jgi:hypothetical protein
MGVVIVIVSAQRNRTQGMSQPAAIAICKTAPSKLQRAQSCKTGITAQKEPAGHNTRVTKNILLEITTPDRLFTAALWSSHQQHPQQPSHPPPKKESFQEKMCISTPIKSQFSHSQ